ncbi:MAG: GlgB N-terminal domain-containing protein, partial [Desulfomonilaceae bacterium]
MLPKEFLTGVTKEDIERIIRIEHSDPHSVLGAHPSRIDGQDGLIFRFFHPEAISAQLIIDDEPIALKSTDLTGFFWAWLPNRFLPLEYLVKFIFENGDSWTIDSPYRFMPTLGDLDLHFMGEGKHYDLYEKMGAHPCSIDGSLGVSFCVWAPNAKRVSVIGDFNNWDGRLFPMRCMGGSGIWELFIPGLSQGSLYKFEIKSNMDVIRIKTDPFAFGMELRPGTASKIWDLDTYIWTDKEWIQNRDRIDHFASRMN